MADRSRQEAGDVVAANDFGRFRRLVDVGGGVGVLLAQILAATPHLHGVLFDRPEVVEQARERLTAVGVTERSEFVGGDFFISVPSGRDAYLLSRVIHDWDDEAALQILASCYRAMKDGGTLLLVEAILPERAHDNPAAIRMDLHMLMLSTGRERTRAEFERLLSQTGFGLTRVVPAPRSGSASSRRSGQPRIAPARALAEVPPMRSATAEADLMVATRSRPRACLSAPLARGRRGRRGSSRGKARSASPPPGGRCWAGWPAVPAGYHRASLR